MISLLVAMDRNRVIGLNGELPWRLPEDLRFFKNKTTGNTMIMGRKTFPSTGMLPNRKTVVVTSNKEASFPDDVDVLHDIDDIKALNDKHPDKEWFVVGGGNIFGQVIGFADRMYITWIDAEFEGDTYFPDFDEKEWDLTKRVKGEKNEKNPYDYYFLQYDRKNN